VSALATRRWLDEGTVWFAVSGIGPELAGAAAQVLMGYEHAGPLDLQRAVSQRRGLADRVAMIDALVP